MKSFLEEEINGETIYLEYGTGEATHIAVAKGARVITVEVDWLLFLENLDRYETEIANGRIDILYFNVGFLDEQGLPINPDYPLVYKDYVTTPWDHAMRNRLSPDIVMINGLQISDSLEATVKWAKAPTKILVNLSKNGNRTLDISKVGGMPYFVDELLVLDYSPTSKDNSE